MRINKRLVLGLVFISSFALWLSASCSAKLSQQPPLNWFIVRFELDEHAYPEGITFFVEKEEASTCFENSDRISITNDTSIPIYFEARTHRMESLDDYEPCPTDNLCLKVDSNKAWEWNYRYLGNGTPRVFEWEIIESNHGIDRLSLNPWYEGLSPTGSLYFLDVFDNQNIEGYGGDRPDDVSVPETQYFELPYVYDGMNGGVGVTVNYVINECYPNESFFYESTPYSEVLAWFIVIVLVVTLALILIIVSGVNKIKNNK
jgi:hypothetical protein